jgi:hypothetical protein
LQFLGWFDGRVGKKVKQLNLDVRNILCKVHILSIGGDALTNGGALLSYPQHFQLAHHPVGGETASLVEVPVPTSVVVQYLSLIGLLGFGKTLNLWCA